MIDDTDVAIITSGEALARLARLMPAPAQQHLWRLPLVVPSQRVVEQAVRLGFLSTPKVPEQVSDAAYLHCLEQRSEEHTSELQSLMRISYAVFCLKKKIHPLFTKSTQAHSPPAHRVCWRCRKTSEQNTHQLPSL